jgi:transposase
MWKPEHRQAAKRDGVRYPSDLTDAEWAWVGPMIPPAKRGGRPRDVDVREVLTRFCTCCPLVANGRRCQRICRRRAPRADGGYQGPKAARAAALTGTWTIDIVKRLDAAIGFNVLPKRWIVERTFGWLSHCRRLARDFERYTATVAAFIVSGP